MRRLARVSFLFALGTFTLGGTRAPEKEIELWTWALRPAFDTYMQDALAAFEADHPGVKVRWVDVPGDAIVRKYFAAGAAGRLPDVVNLPDKVFLRMATLGGVKSLSDAADPVLPADPRAVYVGAALDGCTVRGHLFALPWYLSTEISVLNTELLQKGGLTPDTVGKTWAELLAQLKPFYEKTGSYLLTLRLGDVDLLNLISSEGLPPLNVRDGKMQSNLTSPEIVELMEKWVAAYRAGYLPRESATADWPAVVQSFKEGRVALVNGDAVRSVKNDAPRVYASLAVRPGVVGGGEKTNLSSVVIAVGAQTREPKLAGELAWLLTSAPWQERLCRQASRVPSVKASLDKPDFSAVADSGDKLREALGIGSAQLRDGRSRSFIPETGQWPEMEKIFGEEMKRALLENVPVRDALARAGQKWNDLLAAEDDRKPAPTP